MVFGEARRVVWLDKFIGVVGDYLNFKRTFNDALQPITTMPPNNINYQIQYFEQHVCPIIFVDNAEDALAYIQGNPEKTIVWISSGTAGQPIIPTIVKTCKNVQRYYIFCGYIQGIVEWLLDNEYDLFMQVFDHEMDLLMRLMRDSSDDIITLGRSYLELQSRREARECFLTAEELEIRANEIDSLHPPYMTNLKLLQDPGGLIAQANE